MYGEIRQNVLKVIRLIVSKLHELLLTVSSQNLMPQVAVLPDFQAINKTFTFTKCTKLLILILNNNKILWQGSV